MKFCWLVVFRNEYNSLVTLGNETDRKRAINIEKNAIKFRIVVILCISRYIFLKGQKILKGPLPSPILKVIVF